METIEKLEILTDAAKYDVACTSSGADRNAERGKLGNAVSAGICHSFAADGRCISLLKVLLSNACKYDCAYCVNRCTNDVPRASFAPRELADLTIGFYRRNFIEGLFLSSGVLRSPDYTMEQLCEVISILRDEYQFRGYIHAKAIPGASPELVNRLGLLADRISVNIELPSQRSLEMLAPDKGRKSIFEPMGVVRDHIAEDKETKAIRRKDRYYMAQKAPRMALRSYAPAGQSTQMIVGATPESDFHILRLASSLYKGFDLKRVFYSAYLPVNSDPLLPNTTAVPLQREHRLYQADWLMRFYQFDVNEIISEDDPFLDPLLDPKCNWAMRNLDVFPVEINTAPYELLLRVPGIGVRGAQKIVRARRGHTIGPEELKKLGVTFKRARHFITCNGRYQEGLLFEHDLIYKSLTKDSRNNQAALVRKAKGRRGAVVEGQISLLDDPSFMPLSTPTLGFGRSMLPNSSGVQPCFSR